MDTGAVVGLNRAATMPAALFLFLKQFTYPAAFVLLAFAGLVMPIPQDVTLMIAGYLVHRGVMETSATLPVCIIGVVVGDSMLFWIARKGADRLQRVPAFGRLLAPARLARAQGALARHEAVTIAVARNVAGLRAAVFATAGATGTSFRRFLLWDSLSSIPNVALFVALGYFFSNRVKTLTRDVTRAEGWMGLAVAAVVLALVVVTALRRRARRPAP